MIEEALQNELVQAVLDVDDGEDGNVLENLLESLDENGSLTADELEDIEDALTELNAGEGDASVKLAVQTELGLTNTAIGDAETALDNFYEDTTFSFDSELVAEGNFATSSRTIQDTLLSETNAALNEAVTEVEAAVSQVTGLSGRISTLQTRKANFEAALEAQSDADTAVVDYVATISSVTGVDIDWNSDNQALTTIAVATETDGNDAPDFENGTATYDVATGEWSGVALPQSVQDNLGALLATYAEANGARATAEELFETAIARVVDAEDIEDGNLGGEGEGFDIDIDGDGAFDGLTLDLGTAAPLSQALIDLREARADLEGAVENMLAVRELVDTLAARDADIQTAEDAFEGFGLNLIGEEDDLAGTAGNDLFLFSNLDNNDEITEFGEQGQDHIFFGDVAYQLVQLQEGETINDRVGSATELEVFWMQDGADLVLYVENEAAAGTDTGADNIALAEITTITLAEFSAEDVLFENGLLSTNTTPVEIA